MYTRIALATLATALTLSACGSSTTPEQPGYATVHIKTTPVDGDCELKGKGFMMATRTPADVVVPVSAAPMEVTCVKIGYKGSGVLSSSYDPWSPGNVGTLGLGRLLDSESPVGRSLPETFQVSMSYAEAGTAADIAIMKAANEAEAAKTGGTPGQETGTAAKPEKPPVTVDESALPPSPQAAPMAKTESAPMTPDAGKATRKEATSKAMPDKPVAPKPTEKETAPPAAEPMKLAAVDAFRVHLTSFRKKPLAERSWRNLQKEYPQVLGKLQPIIEQVDVGSSKGLFYRVYAGPLADAKAARDLCFVLRQKNVYCRPVSKGGQ